MIRIILFLNALMFAAVTFGQEPGSVPGDKLVPETILLKEQPRSVDLPPNKKLSHSVKFEIGTAKFVQGDSITISSIHGTSSEISINETYRIEGSYTLASHDKATLASFVTTSEGGGSPTGPKQEVKIVKGNGTFSLVITTHDKGYPHVSFYPSNGGEVFGGVYFGKGSSTLKK